MNYPFKCCSETAPKCQRKHLHSKLPVLKNFLSILYSKTLCQKKHYRLLLVSWGLQFWTYSRGQFGCKTPFFLSQKKKTEDILLTAWMKITYNNTQRTEVNSKLCFFMFLQSTLDSLIVNLIRGPLLLLRFNYSSIYSVV